MSKPITASPNPEQPRIVIDQVIIDDPYAVGALNQLEKGQQQSIAEIATTIAARSLRECEESELISNIKEAVKEDREEIFSQLWEGVKEELEEHRDGVETTLEKDGEKLRKELAVKIQEKVSEIEEKLRSPLTSTDTRAQTIEQDVAEIRQLLAEQQGADQIIEKTTKKGMKFQEEVAELLEKIFPTATVKRVWNSKGAKNNKKGDIVFQSQKDNEIVIECKNKRVANSTNAWREIEEAVENRQTCFGILLFKELPQCPNNLAPLTLNGNVLVTALDAVGLKIALDIGETVRQLQKIRNSQGDIQEAKDMLNTALTETRKLTSLVSLARSIKNDAGKMMNQVKHNKQQIEAILSKTRELIDTRQEGN